MEYFLTLLEQNSGTGWVTSAALLVLAFGQLLKHLPPVIDSIRKPWKPVEREDEE
jgi:hypothetical protein